MTSSSKEGLSEAIESACCSLSNQGYGQFLAPVYRELVGEKALSQLPEVLDSFAELTKDQHMGDGGSYRYRAYSRFSLVLDGDRLELVPLDGNSIFQSTEDNSVNGGVLRTFAPLSPSVSAGPLLQAMVEQDFLHAQRYDRELCAQEVVVGVHQVRIVTTSGEMGLPAPEGIHRDRERFTFQHFMSRHNIVGGEFRVHDEAKEVLFSWLQEDCLDTVVFEGSTWHSATPISVAGSPGPGYRDIFLIDFDTPGPRDQILRGGSL